MMYPCPRPKVAVAVGLGGDPLGRYILEEVVSGSAGSVSAGTEGAGGYLSMTHLL